MLRERRRACRQASRMLQLLVAASTAGLKRLVGADFRARSVTPLWILSAGVMPTTFGYRTWRETMPSTGRAGGVLRARAAVNHAAQIITLHRGRESAGSLSNVTN